MTSKGLEMLEILKQRNDTLKINHKIGSRDIANQEIKEITQCFDNYVIPVIEKELKVLEQLEILKKYYPPFKKFLEEMFEKCYNEDLTKIKEWLEHDS